MALKEIPDRYLGMIIHFLMNFHNDTSEFSHPHLRKSFQYSYVFFVFMYSIIFVSGLGANIMLLHKIYNLRPYNISMYKYLACNAINDMIKCVVIMPMALSTTLFQNWVYGSFFCYLFPMLQDIPFHGTMLTFLLIGFDRHRQIVYPLKPPFSSFLCMVGVWVATVFAVLPYAVYTRYLDLEIYLGAQFKDTGICAINVDDNIEEYIRGLFIIMYVLPLGLIAYLHVKASEEIKIRQAAFTVSYHDVNVNGNRESDSVSSLNPNLIAAAPLGSRVSSSVTLTVPKEYPMPCQNCEDPYSQDKSLHFSVNNVSSEDNKDWQHEKKLQNFLASAVTAYAVCLLPLNLVRLLKHVVYETYESSYHFDLTFITVAWLAFVPTVTTPLIFQHYHKPGENVINISRYLRLGRSSDVSFSAYDLQKRETSRNTLTAANLM